jgi:hypothetical protein
MSPTFNFTSGNPSNLVAGQTANMADIQGSLTDLRAGINGNLDEVNVPNLTAAFTAYRPPQKFVGQITTGGVGTTFLLSTAGSIQNVVPNTASADPSPTFFYLDPADFTANARTTKLRLRAGVVTNNVAPAITFTVGLYPVTALGGAGPAAPFVASLGTVVTGSPVAVASPPAGSGTWQTGTDFNCPAAGAYVAGVVTTAAVAANSSNFVFAFLAMRQV